MVKGSLGFIRSGLYPSRWQDSQLRHLTLFILAAISQLGIARFFIETTFTGFIAALALGIGISLGLGSKDLIKTLLEGWYKSINKK